MPVAVTTVRANRPDFQYDYGIYWYYRKLSFPFQSNLSNGKSAT